MDVRVRVGVGVGVRVGCGVWLRVGVRLAVGDFRTGALDVRAGCELAPPGLLVGTGCGTEPAGGGTYAPAEEDELGFGVVAGARVAVAPGRDGVDVAIGSDEIASAGDCATEPGAAAGGSARFVPVAMTDTPTTRTTSAPHAINATRAHRVERTHRIASPVHQPTGLRVEQRSSARGEAFSPPGAGLRRAYLGGSRSRTARTGGVNSR